jgi:hypothetical protein
MIERVVTALISDDLRLRETACDLDKVIASGWSGRSRSLGALAFRSRYTLDVERTRQFVQSVSRLALAKARQKKRGGTREEIERLGCAVCFWWLSDKCRTCAGRGCMVLGHQQHVSNIVCQTCGGTGIAPMPKAKDVGLEWDEAEFDFRFRELLQAIDVAFEDFNRGTIAALRAPTSEDMRGVEKTVV